MGRCVLLGDFVTFMPIMILNAKVNKMYVFQERLGILDTNISALLFTHEISSKKGH